MESAFDNSPIVRGKIAVVRIDITTTAATPIMTGLTGAIHLEENRNAEAPASTVPVVVSIDASQT
jgi:hypothetical protein